MSGFEGPWTHWLINLATGGWQDWIELPDGTWVPDAIAFIYVEGGR